MEQQDNCIKDETGLYFLRDGIIHCIYQKKIIIDLPTIKKVIKNRNILADGIPRPLLIDIRGILYWTREAKHHTWVNKEALHFITAIAPVINSLPVKITVDWTINFFPPTVPIKIFREIPPAIKWLEKYKSDPSIKDPGEK